MANSLKLSVLSIAVLIAAPAFAQGPGYGHQGGCPMMGQGMMGQGMMGQNMMGRQTHDGGMGPGMQGNMMGPMGGMMSSSVGNPKLNVMMMIATADTNGDQAVSFDEVMAVHERMFGMIDANKDGKVDQSELASVLAPDGEKH